ncbi:hypothetical protein [Yersinia ruckeri]|uniref:hypothetical protein n=1 Tax=Yersinia ruckeri TaxID=29486 RepID=UPI0005368058|nr:hypothetical protein [Yersinia ruckeri]AUQ43831.1 hypothetical protein NJ56_17825 [Yersinia ruckeri]
MKYIMKVKGHSIEFHSICELITLKFDKLVDVFYVIKKLGTLNYFDKQIIIRVIKNCEYELTSGMEVLINKISVCRINQIVEVEELPQLFILHEKAALLAMLSERGALA